MAKKYKKIKYSGRKTNFLESKIPLSELKQHLATAHAQTIYDESVKLTKQVSFWF